MMPARKNSKPSVIRIGEHELNVSVFHKAILFWGKRNFRSYPWRLTEDPYQILIAEVMLHRTQAKQVVPVYEGFIIRFPNVYSLSKASKKDLYKIISPLGLQWRLDLIREMANQLDVRFNGKIPESKNDLLSLPGVSEYIAGAVRCFSWNIPEPLVDTNTVRVIGRLFGLEIKDSSRRNSLYRKTIESLVHLTRPRAYNYALLDLAHLICLKRALPLCGDCPIQTLCSYGASLTNSKTF
ncbi:MAG: hypothetical protein L6406_16370 [Desulfobacterales bacterium]|nr:hypothetical protein [Desulfobacterales bacterium]